MGGLQLLFVIVVKGGVCVGVCVDIAKDEETVQYPSFVPWHTRKRVSLDPKFIRVAAHLVRDGRLLALIHNAWRGAWHAARRAAPEELQKNIVGR